MTCNRGQIYKVVNMLPFKDCKGNVKRCRRKACLASTKKLPIFAADFLFEIFFYAGME
jgi:hypothetical protein